MLETPENEGSEGQKRTKTSILCSKSQKTRVSKAKKAQKWSFCAREEGDWNREVQPLPSSKSPRIAMKVNCLVMRYLHFGSVRGDLLERRTGQVAGISSIQHLRPDQAAALFATQHLRPGQAAASFGGDTEVA